MKTKQQQSRKAKFSATDKNAQTKPKPNKQINKQPISMQKHAVM